MINLGAILMPKQSHRGRRAGLRTCDVAFPSLLSEDESDSAENGLLHDSDAFLAMILWVTLLAGVDCRCLLILEEAEAAA